MAAQGSHIGGFEGASLDACKRLCEEDKARNSITWETPDGQINCWLKEKCLSANEPNETNVDKSSSYYIPH